MPTGAIYLSTNDAQPEMVQAYADDTKAPLLPTPATAEHTTEPSCKCARKCNKKRSRARRAFRHILFLGLTFLLVKAAFTHFNLKPWNCGKAGFKPAEIMDQHHPHPEHPPHDHPHHDHPHHDHPDEDWFYDIPSDLQLEECVTGDKFEEEEDDRHLHAASTQFEVSKADTLFYLSRGQLSQGFVKVLSSPDQDSDKATIKVTAKYILDEVRDLAKVCLSTRGEDSRGVGTFTPTWHAPRRHPRDHDHHLHFETTITLPEGSDDDPVIINNFETDVPNTSQLFEDLSKVFFKDLKVSGTNGGVGANFVQAISLTAKTTNGPIGGHFNTTESVQLITTNGPIRADVGLHNIHDKTLSLDARTTNSPLELIVSAVSTTTEPGSFDVDAHTTNGPLAINFQDAPVDSKITVDGTTTNNFAKATLHPSFEGKFALSTGRWFPIHVDYDSELEDPAGKGRKRIVSASSSRGQASGEVRWDAEKAGEGNVVIKTTNGPVTLKF